MGWNRTNHWKWLDKETLGRDDLHFGHRRFPIFNMQIPDWVLEFANRRYRLVVAALSENWRVVLNAMKWHVCRNSWYRLCKVIKNWKRHGWSMTVVHLCSTIVIVFMFNEQHRSYAPAVHRHSLATSPRASRLRVSHAWEWPMEAATWSSRHVASYPWKFKCIKEMNGFLNMLDDRF